MFKVIEGLTPVSSEDWQPAPACTKTTFVPNPAIQHAASLAEQGHGPEDVLQLHHCPRQPPLLTLDVVRTDLVVQAHELLLASHSLYTGVLPGQHLQGLRELLQQHNGLVSREASASCPVYSVVVPDRPGLHLQASQILWVGSVDKQLAALYDPMEEAGVEQEGREVAISSQQFWQTRLEHCLRDGPGSRPGLVLARTLEHVTHVSQFAGVARMKDIAGSKASLRKVKLDLQAGVEWHCAPMFFLTTTSSLKSPRVLATWVSHTAGMEGRQEQVWHVGSEQQLLPLLPGRELPREAGHYFVHCKTGEPGDCPFHELCTRRPVDEWRQRLVVLIIVNKMEGLFYA